MSVGQDSIDRQRGAVRRQWMRQEQTEDPVRLLRRRWKPIKERLALGGEHPSNVRFHRACNGAWQRILSPLLDRIYVLRCQLVHGAATSGRSLNRDSVRRCVQMLHHLSIAALDVYIEYPPTQ